MGDLDLGKIIPHKSIIESRSLEKKIESDFVNRKSMKDIGSIKPIQSKKTFKKIISNLFK